jgi:hypothetical protein
MEVSFRYGAVPGEREMRALGTMRDVYGIRRLSLDSAGGVIRVEYDASRLKEPAVASLLRQAGVDLREKISLF